MNLPAVPGNLLPALEVTARNLLVNCRCGRKPRIGFIAAMGRAPGTYNPKQIEAIEVRCECGAWMQEAIDFEETMADVYPSAVEKVNAALYHWSMCVKHNLPLNRPAELDRLIQIAEKHTLPGYETRLEYLGNSAELVLRIERNSMNEKETEQMIQDRGLTAPRLSPSLIDAAIVAEQYHVFPGTVVTACCLTLRNGFNVVGESAPISAENFSEEIGRKVAKEKAREKIWALEGYRLKESIFMESLKIPE